MPEGHVVQREARFPYLLRRRLLEISYAVSVLFVFGLHFPVSPPCSPPRLHTSLSQTSTSPPTLPDLKLGHNVFRACRDTALAATYKESSGAGGASGSSAGVKQVGSGVGVV